MYFLRRCCDAKLFIFVGCGWQLSPPQCLSQCCGIGSGYTGHYVVVCGYDADRQEFELRDPASSSALLVVSESGFEDARKAF
jgi:hypothetical protein